MNLHNDARLTVAGIAPLIRKRKISPVELTEFFLERISRFDRSLNAFITVTGEFARKQARRAEKEIAGGRYRGPLHGIPITLKDLFYTAGIRTTAGSKILGKFIPQFVLEFRRESAIPYLRSKPLWRFGSDHEPLRCLARAHITR